MIHAVYVQIILIRRRHENDLRMGLYRQDLLCQLDPFIIPAYIDQDNIRFLRPSCCIKSRSSLLENSRISFNLSPASLRIRCPRSRIKSLSSEQIKIFHISFTSKFDSLNQSSSFCYDVVIKGHLNVTIKFFRKISTHLLTVLTKVI